MADIRKMSVGSVVDFAIAYNERQERAEKEAERQKKKEKRRKATQDDINSFFR